MEIQPTYLTAGICLGLTLKTTLKLIRNSHCHLSLYKTHYTLGELLRDNNSWLVGRTFGSVFGKRDLWQFFHKLDSRETSLLNAANHLKIFLIEFEICLYEHLYFLYIKNPLFPIVAFISMFWQVNMFYPKNSFPIV